MGFPSPVSAHPCPDRAFPPIPWHRGQNGFRIFLCLALTGVGVSAWSLLDDPVIGLALFMLADIAGAVPTLRDTWHDPRKESPEAWLLGLAGSAANLTLVDPSAWTESPSGFAIWGLPVYLTVLNAGDQLSLPQQRVSSDAPAVVALSLRG